MLKKILALVFIISVITNVPSFSYTWVSGNGGHYVYDDNNEIVTDSLVDTGEGVYYFDEFGQMVIGWWENTSTSKVYFFNNNPFSAYGSMLFGLHMIDGYYRYFKEDGSLDASDKEGDYKKVYLEFYADHEGNIYYNNVLMRDTGANKSEFYSDPLYYTDAKYNNAWLFENGAAKLVGLMKGSRNENKKTPGSQAIVSQANFENGSIYYVDPPTVVGGTNYTVDSEGKVIDNTKDTEVSDFEIFGPTMNGAPPVNDK